MIGALFLLDTLIWYVIWKGKRDDSIRKQRREGNFPENPLYDFDLAKLYDCPLPQATGWISIDGVDVPLEFRNHLSGCSLDIELDEKIIQQNYRELAENPKYRSDLFDYLWAQEWINKTTEVIWCDGTPIDTTNPEAEIEFLQIKNKAYLKGMYNSKLLEDGGEDDLHRDWFRIKGCSDYGAEKLVDMGIKPWEFDL